MKNWKSAEIVELNIDETAETYKVCESTDGYIYDDQGNIKGWKMGVEETSTTPGSLVLDQYNN